MLTVAALWLVVLAGAAGNTHAVATGAGTLVRLAFGVPCVCGLGVLILLRLRHSG